MSRLRFGGDYWGSQMLRSANQSKNQTDIIVLGGGLAGLSFAIQCRQQLPDAKITVLEKREHPVPEAAFKVGESTVEVAAHYFGKVCLLYKSPSPRDATLSRMPSSA